MSLYILNQKHLFAKIYLLNPGSNNTFFSYLEFDKRSNYLIMFFYFKFLFN